MDIFKVFTDLLPVSITVTDTKPFTPTFEQYEIGDMSFYANSGSLNIMFMLILANFIIMELLLRLAKRYFKFKLCRKVGIKAQ